MKKLPFDLISSRKVAAIDMDVHTMRMAVLTKKGSRAVVLSCDRIEGEDIAGNIRKLLDANKHFKGQGIVISDQVRFLASELNVQGTDNLSEEKLLAASAWEIEPYLDFPVKEAIIASQTLGNKTGKDNIPIIVSAIKRKDYTDISGLLKNCGIKLRHAYAKEWALALSAELPQKGSNKIIIECRSDSIRGVLTGSDGPVEFQTLPLGQETTAGAVIRQLIYDLSTITDSLEKILITGEPVREETMQGLKEEFEKLGYWQPADLGAVDVAPEVDNFGPMYATAVSVAFQEIGLAGKPPLAVTDRISLTKSLSTKLKTNRNLLPILLSALFLFGITAHYAINRITLYNNTSEIKSLRHEKKKLLAPIEEKARLTSRLDELQKKKIYIEQILPARNDNLINLLSTILEVIPPDVALNQFIQQKNGGFYLDGNASNGGSAAIFRDRLSLQLKECKSVSLNLTSGGGISDVRTRILPYHFGINIRFHLEK